MTRAHISQMVERLVLSFTAIPFVSTVTWWLIQHVGIGASPYIYFVASALAYYGLQLPQVSSLSDERNKSHNGADTAENKKSNDGVPHDEAAEKYLAELSAGCKCRRVLAVNNHPFASSTVYLLAVGRRLSYNSSFNWLCFTLHLRLSPSVVHLQALYGPHFASRPPHRIFAHSKHEETSVVVR